MEEQSKDKDPKVTPEMLRELLDAVSKNIDGMMREFGISHLNYTTRQLEVLERLVDDRFPVGHKPMPTTIIPFAFYLGECIVRNVPGAKWEIAKDASAINEIAISLTGSDTLSRLGTHVYPFNRVWKFWNDRTDRMSTMLRMVMRMDEVQLNPEYLKKRIGADGWIQTFYGDCYRMLVAKEDKSGPKEQSFMEAMNAIAKKMEENNNGKGEE